MNCSHTTASEALLSLTASQILSRISGKRFLSRSILHVLMQFITMYTHKNRKKNTENEQKKNCRDGMPKKNTNKVGKIQK